MTVFFHRSSHRPLRDPDDGGPRHRIGGRGQSVVEFALILPVLLTLVLGAIDFGRVMQARVTSESAAKAGASWGASHLANATSTLEPAFALDRSPFNCGSGAGLDNPPTCNVLARSCAEAAGLPGYSGGPDFNSTGPPPDSRFWFKACTIGTVANVCSPSASQSNPVLSVKWAKPNGDELHPPAAGQTPKVGDTVTVTGTYCFKTFFPGPISKLTWTSSATYAIQP